MNKNKSIDEVMDALINTIESYNNEYIDFSKKNTNQNFRNMLLSVIEQKKEHLKRIKEIKQLGNLESIFSEKQVNIDVPALKYTSDIKYLEFLEALIERHEILSRIYLQLMECSTDQDIKLLFKRLEFDISKQKSIISNRYELEKINMG